MLSFKAEFDGIASLGLKPGCELCISVKNPLSDYEVREKVTVNTSEYLEQDDNSREKPHHFRVKWEGSKKYSTITVLTLSETKAALKKLKKRNVTCTGKVETSGEFVPICGLECRGVEPYEFHALDDQFVIEYESGQSYDEDIDLTKGDWAGYDEESGVVVSIEEFEATFVFP